MYVYCPQDVERPVFRDMADASFSGVHFLKCYVIMSLPKDYCSRIHNNNQYTKQAGFHIEIVNVM